MLASVGCTSARPSSATIPSEGSWPTVRGLGEVEPEVALEVGLHLRRGTVLGEEMPPRFGELELAKSSVTRMGLVKPNRLIEAAISLICFLEWVRALPG